MTAAINQLAFGSVPGLGAGNACGRCFAVTADADPYDPEDTGPFTTIIVKVTDMCPVAGNEVSMVAMLDNKSLTRVLAMVWTVNKQPHKLLRNRIPVSD